MLPQIDLALFLGKPFWYLALLALAARYFAIDGPHWRWPTWAVVTLAALGRYGAGFAAYGMTSLAHQLFPQHVDRMATASFVLLVLCGLVLWWVTARVAFRRSPSARLWRFALFAELLSGAIDFWAWREVSHFNIC